MPPPPQPSLEPPHIGGAGVPTVSTLHPPSDFPPQPPTWLVRRPETSEGRIWGQTRTSVHQRGGHPLFFGGGTPSLSAEGPPARCVPPPGGIFCCRSGEDGAGFVPRPGGSRRGQSPVRGGPSAAPRRRSGARAPPARSDLSLSRGAAPPTPPNPPHTLRLLAAGTDAPVSPVSLLRVGAAGGGVWWQMECVCVCPPAPPGVRPGVSGSGGWRGCEHRAVSGCRQK